MNSWCNGTHIHHIMFSVIHHNTMNIGIDVIIIANKSFIDVFILNSPYTIDVHKKESMMCPWGICFWGWPKKVWAYKERASNKFTKKKNLTRIYTKEWVSEWVSEWGGRQVSGLEYEVWYRKTLIPDWSVSSPFSPDLNSVHI